VHAKEVEYIPGAGGAVRAAVPDERRRAACLDRGALDALVETAKRVEGYFGAPQDIEWAIARGGELPSSLYVLQSRPVTTVRKPTEKAEPTSALELLMGTFGANAGSDPGGV
jgi:pyruvate,water dikinase